MLEQLREIERKYEWAIKTMTAENLAIPPTAWALARVEEDLARLREKIRQLK